MIQINLLPWREEARKTKQIYFGILVGSCIVFTFILIIITHLYYGHLVLDKQQALAYLQSVITKRQADFTSLQSQKLEQQKLKEQLQFLINLQNQSLRGVRLLDQLITIVPSSIILQTIDRQNDVVTITGSAQSDLQVTIFIKSLSQTPGLVQPTLTAIRSDENSSLPQRLFQLKVKQQDVP